MRCLFPAFSVVFLSALTCGVAAQDRKPLAEVPGEKKTQAYEIQTWYVAKAIPPVVGESQILYTGPSKDDAEKACTKWEEANKKAKPNWITNVGDPVEVKVPVIRPATPRDKPKVEIPDPKFVDPGSTKKAAKPVAELKGKKAKGQIGDLKVAFEFTDKDKLEITGEATGSGKWKMDGSSLYMETALSTFRGSVNEAGAAGLRFRKDGTEPLTQWRFSLAPNPEPSSQQAQMAGKWVGPYSLEINDKNEVTLFGSIGQLYGRMDDRKNGRNLDVTLESKTDGNSVSIKLSATGYYEKQSKTFEGKWDGKDEIKGTIRWIYRTQEPQEATFRRKVEK